MTVLAAGAAHAEDFSTRADVTGAVVYGGGAEVTRQASLTVPAGSHRILVPMPSYVTAADRVSVTLQDGRTLGPVRLEPAPGFEDGQFDTEAQAALRAEIDGLEAQIEEAEAALSRIDSEISVLTIQQRYLESYASGGSEGGTAPDGIAAVLSSLGEEMARVAAALLAAQERRAEQEDAIADLRETLGEAEADLAALFPLGAGSAAISLPVQATEETQLDLTLTHFVHGFYWDMAYTARLSTVENRLTLDRSALVGGQIRDRWQDIALTLSGEEWGQALAMTGVTPSRARIEEERPPGVVQDRVVGSAAGGFAAPSMEPAIVTEDAALAGYGLSFSAEIAASQTLTGGEETLVPFTSLALEADVTVEANPRRDDTAFLIARAENTTGEPLIPGEISVYRDGAFLSEDYLDTIPPGGEVELPFGAVEHLQLFWRDLSRNEAGDGLFSRSNRQVQVVEFGVTNISDNEEEVRILYAVPFSEQEDLELDLSLSVPPSEQDVDGRRGIHAWDVTVGPSETRTIRMEAEMSWPEGYDLYWRP